MIRRLPPVAMSIGAKKKGTGAHIPWRQQRNFVLFALHKRRRKKHIFSPEETKTETKENTLYMSKIKKKKDWYWKADVNLAYPNLFLEKLWNGFRRNRKKPRIKESTVIWRCQLREHGNPEPKKTFFFKCDPVFRCNDADSHESCADRPDSHSHHISRRRMPRTDGIVPQKPSQDADIQAGGGPGLRSDGGHAAFQPDVASESGHTGWQWP